ncbi:ATPase, T2SS/T4P/T4SS family [Pseudomonas aeruginosa]|nr:ATPase, T2SS/T4P/T4SS family [Pseudomonas aeruginosa]
MTSQPNGIILVTGPTGSGKTTTLYTTLKQLATDEVNVSTIEDPIEMIEPSFNQMQVQHNIDLTFASGVRALAAAGPGHHHGRRDPRPGDRRDGDPGGAHRHLVLSTLHTNDSPRRSPACSNWAYPTT